MEDNNSFGLSASDSGLLKAIHSGSISFKAFEEDILALESIVAGTSHQNLVDTEKEIIVKETELQLLREPENQFDTFAVLVKFKDHKLGYLPKAKNQTIARLMDAGKRFYAKAVAKEWEGKWLRIDLEVYMKD